MATLIMAGPAKPQALAESRNILIESLKNLDIRFDLTTRFMLPDTSFVPPPCRALSSAPARKIWLYAEYPPSSRPGCFCLLSFLFVRLPPLQSGPLFLVFVLV